MKKIKPKALREDREELLEKAISFLREKQHESKGLAGLAAILANHGEYVDRTTIHRWLLPGADHHRRTQDRILRAYEIVEAFVRTPLKVRFAVIRHATEMLPIHLLKGIPHIEQREGAQIVVNETANSIDELFDLLQNDEVDMVMAPRRTNIGADYLDVRRFFRVEMIKVRGIFPVKYQTPRQLGEELNKLRTSNKNFVIGCLPNADYRSVIQDFMSNHGGSIPTEIVRSYTEAFELLRRQKIHGVIGHHVFVENCDTLIKGSKLKHLSSLETVRDSVFEDIRMDCYVNVKRIDSKIAQIGLVAIVDSVDYINEQKDNKALHSRVNAILGLTGAPSRSAQNVLSEFVYEVKTFEKNTLLSIWRNRNC